MKMLPRYFTITADWRIDAIGNGSEAWFLVKDTILGVGANELIQVNYIEPNFRFRTLTAGGTEDTLLNAAAFLGSFHEHKVVWSAGDVKWYIDDVLKATHNVRVPSSDMYLFLQGIKFGDLPPSPTPAGDSCFNFFRVIQ